MAPSELLGAPRNVSLSRPEQRLRPLSLSTPQFHEDRERRRSTRVGPWKTTTTTTRPVKKKTTEHLTPELVGTIPPAWAGVNGRWTGRRSSQPGSGSTTTTTRSFGTSRGCDLRSQPRDVPLSLLDHHRRRRPVHGWPREAMRRSHQAQATVRMAVRSCAASASTYGVGLAPGPSSAPVNSTAPHSATPTAPDSC